jgi:hypothetical protein
LTDLRAELDKGKQHNIRQCETITHEPF